MKAKSESEVTQSCLTLRDPMDCSLPRAAPEKSGLHACGQADRVIALESWEGLGPQDTFKKDSRGLCWLGASIGNGHQNRLYFVATVSSDSVNICVQVSVWMFSALNYAPRGGTGAHLLFLKHSPLPTEVSSCTILGRDLLSPSLFCYHGTHPTPIQLLHRALPPPGCSRQVHKEHKSWSLVLQSWL